MLAAASATEVAFLFIAVLQAVFAVLWALGAWWVKSSRAAIAHWALWSGIGAVTWSILAASFESPPLAGVILGVLAAMVLQRGIRLFINRRPRFGFHLALLLIIVIADQLREDNRHWQATINFAVLASLYFDIARDLFCHARDGLRLRWPMLLAAPVLLGAIGYLARSLRALLAPESVLNEMAADSALNVGSALMYSVLVLAMHAMLVSLVVARLIDELRKLSLHDGLTGLLNRRAMEETLHAQVRSTRRSGSSFAVMMLDLDYFKRINDDYGHAVGDLALQHVSKLLGGALRDIDRLARYGGEEFVVLMPGATLSHAQPIAERLRTLLESNPLAHEAIRVPLSVSIGLADWRGDADDVTRLLQRADAALFQAKVQGRNRVVVSTQDPLVQM